MVDNIQNQLKQQINIVKKIMANVVNLIIMRAIKKQKEQTKTNLEIAILYIEKIRD